MRALGDDAAERAVLASLVEFADWLKQAEPKINYFATSLPNLLLFDDDLGKRNRLDALLLRGLANHGCGDADTAMHLLEQVLAEDPNHILAAEMLGWIQSEGKVSPERLKVESAL